MQEDILNVPPIGPVTPDPNVSEWLVSGPYALKCLGGHAVQFVLEGYADDAQKADYQRALQNLVHLDSAALTAVEPHVLQYCNEMLALYEAADRPYVDIEHPSDVWKHVQFDSELLVTRREDDDEEDGIYFSLSCSCDWAREHGLVLVLRDGLAFTKVGPYDGHLTNADAYGDPSLQGVIFKSFRK